MSAITKIFGTHSERELKRIYPLVDKVESYREAMGALSDEELKNKTKEYKERLENGETLDDLLPEAYATVREAAKREGTGRLGGGSAGFPAGGNAPHGRIHL